ncbi:MAG: UbiA family prenyltransferase [Oligoflexia bacterium]|nr:UbiA family prenyltransferase [Oligoflexia bacterium]
MTGHLKSWLELGRVSHLPIVISSATVGFHLGGQGIERSPGYWLALVSALSVLFVAASIMNDLCDLKQDRFRHPKRPLPSGRVPAALAWTATTVLIVAGLALMRTLFPQAMGMALLLLCLLYAYNFLHHRYWLAPLLGGACHSGIYLLAAGTGGRSLASMSLWAMALVLGGYVSAVMVFARRNERWPSLSLYRSLGAIAAFGALPLPALASWRDFPGTHSMEAMGIIGALTILWLASLTRTLVLEGKSRRAILKLSVGICLLDALVLARLGSVGGAAVAAFGFLLFTGIQHRAARA